MSRGSVQVDGVVDSNGADEGRWSLDFADGKTAHVIGCSAGQYGCGGTDGSYVLATADFSNPDAPVVDSELSIPATGLERPRPRFDSGRMYLTPDPDGYGGANTPLEIFDLSNPAAPVLAGQTQVPGTVWLMVPSGNQLFALGSAPQSNAQDSSQLALNYVDVTNAASPTPIGTSMFGEGWASTPAEGTFKAFTMDATPTGSSCSPFSGWDQANATYHDGVQLIEFTPSSIATSGAAHTTGWVERGIFVNNRIVSLSDLALSVVDYSNPLTPAVTASLTLARSVITAQPNGSTIAEISSDWWDNDVTHSDVRILPITDAEENARRVEGPRPALGRRGQRERLHQRDARLRRHERAGPGPVRTERRGRPRAGRRTRKSGTAPQRCYGWQQQVQVVDLANGSAKLRGKIALPMAPNGYYGGWGWYGCYVYDWYNGGDVVQVGGSTLAFRRWDPQYVTNGGTTTWVDASSDPLRRRSLEPRRSRRRVGRHHEGPDGLVGRHARRPGTTALHVSLRMDRGRGDEQREVRGESARWRRSRSRRRAITSIESTSATSNIPRLGSKINVPGALVGGSSGRPVRYPLHHRLRVGLGHGAGTTFDVVKSRTTSRVPLQSVTPLDGYVGNVIVRETTAYMTSQIYSDKLQPNQPQQVLHQLDLSKPTAPVDRVASGPGGWGWLLDVQGDRAMVTSGWGEDGLDIYRLSDTAAPVYDQFVRTRGWSINSLARQGNQIFLSSGYWGVQAVTLQ